MGVTFLFVTHDQEEALSMSDFIAVMNRGAVEQVGTPEDIYVRPATRFVAGFLGMMNWIDGVGLRPESLRLSREPSADSRCGVVTGRTFLGSMVYVETRLENGDTCSAQAVNGATAFAPGEAVHVTWNKADELRLLG